MSYPGIYHSAQRTYWNILHTADLIRAFPCLGVYWIYMMNYIPTMNFVTLQLKSDGEVLHEQ